MLEWPLCLFHAGAADLPLRELEEPFDGRPPLPFLPASRPFLVTSLPLRTPFEDVLWTEPLVRPPFEFQRLGELGLGEPGLAEVGRACPGLDETGLEEPGLDEAGLDETGLAVPGLADVGLDVPGLEAPGLAGTGLAVPCLEDEAGRELVPGREPDTGLAPGPLRRAGRLPFNDCATLRSRPCGAGRLNLGRASGALPLLTGLWPFPFACPLLAAGV